MNLSSSLSFSSKSTVPVILQTEQAECGLACIAMISTFYGHKTDLNYLRKKYHSSLKGYTFLGLSKIINNLEFSGSAYKVQPETLKHLPLPCIVQWGPNHFVVLEKVSSKKISIVDPASGQKSFSLKEAGKFIYGSALTMLPTENFEKKDTSTHFSLSMLVGKIQGLKINLTKVFVVSIALQLFTLAMPFFMAWVVDKVIVSNDTSLLVIMTFGFAVVATLIALSELARSFIILHISSNLSLQVAAKLFKHLISLPVNFFQRRHLGDIISRFRSYETIKNLLSKDLVAAIVDALLATITIILMFIYSPSLTFVVLGFTLAYAILRIATYGPIKRHAENYLVEGANENSNFMETVRSIESVKLFGAESIRLSSWFNTYSRYLNAEIKRNKLVYYYQSAKSLLFGIEAVAVIYLGALSVIDNSLSLGMLFAFITYKLHFTNKVTNLIQILSDLKMLDLHLSRVADIALAKNDDQKEGELDEEITGSSDIVLQNVSFQYSPSEPFLFENLNCTFGGGKSTVIIGPSGAGKTTLVKLLLGLNNPSTGSIFIGKNELSKVPPKCYREFIGTVMQDESPLSGSISDNISFFSEHTDMAHVIKCAKLAQLHDDISSMPMKYNSLVGDMGSTLSGGQRKRLLLARAFYKRPKILILDEATANLDADLEKSISSYINSLSITRIIIAHRQETIDSADVVLRLSSTGLTEVRDDD